MHIRNISVNLVLKIHLSACFTTFLHQLMLKRLFQKTILLMFAFIGIECNLPGYCLAFSTFMDDECRKGMVMVMQ